MLNIIFKIINILTNKMVKYLSRITNLIKISISVILIKYLFISNICYGQGYINKSLNISTPLTTDSRIRTIVYNPNEVFELKFYYGYQSFIEFSEDEEIEMISIGEGFAWRLTPIGKRLFIRPLEIAAHTNMIITTNKRTYHFDIRSGEYDGRADEELIYTVRFFYPQPNQILPLPPKLSVPNQFVKSNNISNLDSNNDASNVIISDNNNIIKNNNKSKSNNDYTSQNLNFNYSFVGRDQQIIPTKIFDDGIQTMIEFTSNNDIIPEISIVDNDGNERKLNYVLKNGVVTIPVVTSQLSLRLNQALVCVFNNKIVNNLTPQ